MRKRFSLYHMNEILLLPLPTVTNAVEQGLTFIDGPATGKEGKFLCTNSISLSCTYGKGSILPAAPFLW